MVRTREGSTSGKAGDTVNLLKDGESRARLAFAGPGAACVVGKFGRVREGCQGWRAFETLAGSLRSPRGCAQHDNLDCESISRRRLLSITRWSGRLDFFGFSFLLLPACRRGHP